MLVLQVHNVLVVGRGDNLIFFDLQSKKLLFHYTIRLKIQNLIIKENDLFIVCSDYCLRSLNFPRSSKKQVSPKEGQSFYSIFYDEDSHRIFVTNSSNVFVFDRELNMLKSFALGSRLDCMEWELTQKQDIVICVKVLMAQFQFSNKFLL